MQATSCCTPSQRRVNPQKRRRSAGQPVDDHRLHGPSLFDTPQPAQQAAPASRPPKTSRYLGVSRHRTKNLYESYFSNGGQQSAGSHADDLSAAYARDLGLLAAHGPKGLATYSGGTSRGLNFPFARYASLLHPLGQVAQVVMDGQLTFIASVKVMLEDAEVQAVLALPLPPGVYRLPGGGWAATISCMSHEPLDIGPFPSEYEAAIAHDLAALAADPACSNTIFDHDLLTAWLDGSWEHVHAALTAAHTAGEQEGALLLRRAAQDWAAALWDTLVPKALGSLKPPSSISSGQPAAKGSRSAKQSYPFRRAKGASKKGAAPEVQLLADGTADGTASAPPVRSASSLRPAQHIRKLAARQDTGVVTADAPPLALAGPAAAPAPKPRAKRAREAASPQAKPAPGAASAAGDPLTPCPKRARVVSRRYASEEYRVPAATRTLVAMREGSPDKEAAHALLALRCSLAPFVVSALRRSAVARTEASAPAPSNSIGPEVAELLLALAGSL